MRYKSRFDQTLKDYLQARKDWETHKVLPKSDNSLVKSAMQPINDSGLNIPQYREEVIQFLNAKIMEMRLLANKYGKLRDLIKELPEDERHAWTLLNESLDAPRQLASGIWEVKNEE